MAEPEPSNPPPPSTATQSQSSDPAPTTFPGDASSASHSSAEVAALNSAASNLKISETPGGSEAGAAASSPAISKTTASAAAAAKVKIDAKDVEWMIKQLEVNKAKATEMLRGAGGDRGVAVRRFVVGEA